MLKPLEIEHPLRTIRLKIDDSVTQGNKEKKLLASYKFVHDLAHEFEKKRQELEAGFAVKKKKAVEIFVLFDNIEPRMNSIYPAMQKLIARHDSYKEYNNEQIAFSDSLEKYNKDYNDFYDQYKALDKELDIMSKKYDKVSGSKKALKTAYSELIKKDTVFTDTKKKCAIDFDSYHKDKKRFYCIDKYFDRQL
jgi:chromosome segregation ATPase